MTGRHGNHRRGPKVAGVIVACEVCGRERRYAPGEVRVRGIIRFCSIKCRNVGMVKNRVTVQCDRCGKDTVKRKDHMKTRAHVYCSKGCFSAARRVEGARWRDRAAIREYMRAYIDANRDRMNERSRTWAKANRPKKTAASQRWRARMKGATVGTVDFERIMARDRMVCHLCRRKVAKGQLHFDHVIPLSKGGEHSEINIAVAHGRCNVRKSDRITRLF